MNLRHLVGWKPAFYDVLLPALRWLGPRASDAVLGQIGRTLALPPSRWEVLRGAVERAKEASGADWDVPSTTRALSGNIVRFLARDTVLDGSRPEAFFARFDERGFENLTEALARGRGVILLGCHLGAHLSAAHWLYRRGIGMRMLIQRPAHVSRLLNQEYDATEGACPQAGFFLRRQLAPEEASKRVFRTRAALRDGLVVYMKGDVPWNGANTRPGSLLGHSRSYQSLWAEFAALFRAPVVPVFCTHLPGGRYALTFDPPLQVKRGEEGEAVTAYLNRLEAEILANPSDAVAHLLWPCYGPPDEEARRQAARLAREQRAASAGGANPRAA